MNFQVFKEKYEKVPVKHYSHNVDSTPVISVCVQTYNHEPYIKDCLEGILMQETNFPFEILLGEDASKDGTREICIEYANKYPDKIKLFLHRRENNIDIGGQPTGRFNFLYNLYSAKGKYIALCEGDDYWTDPLKLQKQVEFLEDNEEYSLVISRQRNIDDQGNIIGEGKGGTRTMMFPSSIEIPRKFIYKIPHGDNLLKATLKLHGKCYCFDEVMAVWRKHDGGVWGSLQAKEDQHKLEYNRGLTKLGLGLTFIDEGYVRYGIKYLVQSYIHFFKAGNVKLKLIDKIYFFLKVIKNFLFK